DVLHGEERSTVWLVGCAAGTDAKGHVARGRGPSALPAEGDAKARRRKQRERDAVLAQDLLGPDRAGCPLALVGDGDVGRCRSWLEDPFTAEGQHRRRATRSALHLQEPAEEFCRPRALLVAREEHDFVEARAVHRAQDAVAGAGWNRAAQDE